MKIEIGNDVYYVKTCTVEYYNDIKTSIRIYKNNETTPVCGGIERHSISEKEVSVIALNMIVGYLNQVDSLTV